MIVHMPFLNIVIPVNAKLVYDMLYEMATFDVIPTDSIYEYAQTGDPNVFKADDEEDGEEEVEQVL